MYISLGDGSHPAGLEQRGRACGRDHGAPPRAADALLCPFHPGGSPSGS